MAVRKAVVISLMGLAGCAGTVHVPGDLKPGANESLAMVVPARGVQIYECRDTKWAFVAPEAELYDANGKRIGRHYAGPHWEAADGSRIVATLSKVTSIQRVATTGGVAPAGGCSQAGTQARVPYTADYDFFATK